ncbi:MAG: response regulator transcription factor [Prochlorococcaceae cyanobacterium]
MIHSHRPGATPEPGTPGLFTPAQRQVLDLLLLGWTNGRAAGELQLSERTVESHVQAMLRRSGTRNRTELVLWWLRGAAVDWG